jgi:hypothetical protein
MITISCILLSLLRLLCMISKSLLYHAFWICFRLRVTLLRDRVMFSLPCLVSGAVLDIPEGIELLGSLGAF